MSPCWDVTEVGQGRGEPASAPDEVHRPPYGRPALHGRAPVSTTGPPTAKRSSQGTTARSMQPLRVSPVPGAPSRRSWVSPLETKMATGNTCSDNPPSTLTIVTSTSKHSSFFLHPACKSLCWEPNECLEQTLKSAMPLIGHNFKGCSSGHLQKPFRRSRNDCKM